MMLGAIQLVQTVFDIYSIAIIVRALLSFIVYDPYNPLMQFLIKITEPVLAPIRRVMPSGGGLDFSPIVALLLIRVLESVVVNLMLGGVR